MSIGLQFVLLTIELPEAVLPVKDSGSLNYQYCLSVTPIKREKLWMKFLIIGRIVRKQKYYLVEIHSLFQHVAFETCISCACDLGDVTSRDFLRP